MKVCRLELGITSNCSGPPRETRVRDEDEGRLDPADGGDQRGEDVGHEQPRRHQEARLQQHPRHGQVSHSLLR